MISDDNSINEDIKPPEPEAAEADVTPGQLLSRKREALGLSIQQVADELHITMHYVRALEADAHDKLPGQVFIRGYIRAYANYLKLDPTVLVNVFNEFVNQRDSHSQEASFTRNRHRRDRNLPWIAVSGVAFVVIAVALWYFGTGSAPQTGSVAAPAPARAAAMPPSSQATAGSGAQTLDNVATTRATGVEVQAAPSAPTSTSISAASAATVQAPTPSPSPTFIAPVEPVTAVIAPEFAPAADAAATLAPVAEVLSTPDAVPQASPSAAPSASPAQGISPQGPGAAIAAPGADTQLISVNAGGPDMVEIVFSGESLVQIDDGSARQIYRDIRVAGDHLQVNGTGPFNVLLGDASSAELHLNGKKIDFSGSIRIDNSARLTIGL